MINGKLSALRWVLGDEWDMLDAWQPRQNPFSWHRSRRKTPFSVTKRSDGGAEIKIMAQSRSWRTACASGRWYGEFLGGQHCDPGHVVQIEPGLRPQSTKNGNFSNVRRRLSAVSP
jgi:hypothetical protein